MIPLAEIEWSRFSQNGEDGIIDYLVKRLLRCRRTFVEIGSGSGKQNNTTWLAQQGWTGSVFDRRPKRIDNYRKREFKGVAAYAIEVRPENAQPIVDLVPLEPDVFSLDIDSFDYHVMSALLRLGFRPSIAVLEYNAALDAETVPYPLAHPVKHSYFGCGVAAWRNLLEPAGYRFVTVDSAGVNAVFARADRCGPEALDGVEWLAWADCAILASWYGPANERRTMIADRPLLRV